MTTEIKVPAFPESVAEGEIAAWHKREGDAVAEGEVIVEIETDKVVMEVQAFRAGTITKILKQEGETVTSEEVIGALQEGAAAKATPVETAQAKTIQAAGKDQEATGPAESNADVSPAVRRLLSEHNIEANQIQGSGKDGRLTKEDVEAFLQKSKMQVAAPAKAQVSASAQSMTGRADERVPMSRLRKTVAKRLLEVQQTNAILTTFNEVDMKPVMDLRKKYQDVFEKTHDVRLGFMSFFLKASIEALKRFPTVNASIDGNDIVYHGYYDLGVAVSSPRGLVVPVLRNVDQMSLADIEKAIKAFAVKAKDGSLAIEDMQGGTFTVTNGGVFGSMLSTPIINAPQSAILGMHNIVDRPVAINGEVKIRPIMYLALSYDHRIIDGRESVSFLKTIKEMIEDPARLLLNV